MVELIKSLTIVWSIVSIGQVIFALVLYYYVSVQELIETLDSMYTDTIKTFEESAKSADIKSAYPRSMHVYFIELPTHKEDKNGQNS